MEHSATPPEAGPEVPGIAGESIALGGLAHLVTMNTEQTGQPQLDKLTTLAHAAAAGDRQAAERLMAEVYPVILHFCRSHLGGQEYRTASADDAAQETAIGILIALTRYSPAEGQQFKSLSFRIANHKIIDQFRARNHDHSVVVDELPERPSVFTNNPEDSMLHSELADILNTLLSNLTPHQQRIITLRIKYGCTVEETAGLTGSTPGAVRVTTHRALKRLRRLAKASDLEEA